jgi:hypothetical protein
MTTTVLDNQITILNKLLNTFSGKAFENMAGALLDRGLGDGLMRFVSPTSSQTSEVLDFLSSLYIKTGRHFSSQAIYDKLGLCEKLINWVSKQYLHWT